MIGRYAKSTIKNHSTVPKYLDELISENNLDEEEQKILHTFLKRFMIILMQIDEVKNIGIAAKHKI